MENIKIISVETIKEPNEHGEVDNYATEEINNTTKWDILKKVLVPNSSPFIPNELDEVETAFFAKYFGPQTIQNMRIHCTVCDIHMGSAPNQINHRYVHPLLQVIICKTCYDSYCSTIYTTDKNGLETHCRWCGSEESLLYCTACAFVFCEKCLERNLSPTAFSKIIKYKFWACLHCENYQTIGLRILCRKLYDYSKNQIGLNKNFDTDFSSCCFNNSTSATVTVEDLPSFDSDTEFQYIPKAKAKNAFNLSKNVQHDYSNLKNASTTETTESSSKVTNNTGSNVEVACKQDLLMETTNENSAQLVSKGQPQFSLLLMRPTLSNVTTFENLSPMVPMQNRSLSNDVRKEASQNTEINGRLIRRLKQGSLKQELKLVENALNNMKTGNETHKPNKPVPLPNASETDASSNEKMFRDTHFGGSNVKLGSRYECFDVAIKRTYDMRGFIRSRLTQISIDQTNANAIIDLANVHNSFQQFFTDTINELTTIRRNLRDQFLQNIPYLKLLPPEKEHSNPESTNSSSTAPNSLQASNYIKVKPFARLNPKGSSCTISERETGPRDFDKLIARNMQVYTKGISNDDKKKMLSVKVCAENNYGKYTHPRNDFGTVNISSEEGGEVSENCLVLNKVIVNTDDGIETTGTQLL